MMKKIDNEIDKLCKILKERPYRFYNSYKKEEFERCLDEQINKIKCFIKDMHFKLNMIIKNYPYYSKHKKMIQRDLDEQIDTVNIVIEDIKKGGKVNFYTKTNEMNEIKEKDYNMVFYFDNGRLEEQIFSLEKCWYLKKMFETFYDVFENLKIC